MSRNASYSIWVLLGILLAGCSKSGSFEGVVPDYHESSDRIPVSVYMGDPHQGVSTKGTGSIDSLIRFAGKEIHVFAFSSRSEANYDGTGQNQNPEAPDTLMYNRIALLNGTDANAEWVRKRDTVVFPMEKYSNETYHFFAGYLDDSKIKAIRAFKDKVVFDVEINGTQDLMTNAAMETFIGEDGTTKERIGAYSYETARVDKNPIFTLQHRLVKLRFRLKPGVTPGTEKFIRAEWFQLVGKNVVHLPVASRALDFEAEYGDSKVTFDLTGKKSLPESVCIKTLTDASFYSEELCARMEDDQIDCLLVPPEEAYAYTLCLSEAPEPLDGEEPVFGSSNEYVRTLKFPKEGEAFKAGNAYTITFEVFGLNQVAVYIELDEWHRYTTEDGEDIDLEFTDDKEPK